MAADDVSASNACSGFVSTISTVCAGYPTQATIHWARMSLTCLGLSCCYCHDFVQLFEIHSVDTKIMVRASNLKIKFAWLWTSKIDRSYTKFGLANLQFGFRVLMGISSCIGGIRISNETISPSCSRNPRRQLPGHSEPARHGSFSLWKVTHRTELNCKTLVSNLRNNIGLRCALRPHGTKFDVCYLRSKEQYYSYHGCPLIFDALDGRLRRQR